MRVDIFWVLMCQVLCEHFSPINWLNPPTAFATSTLVLTGSNILESHIWTSEFLNLNLTSAIYCSGTLDLNFLPHFPHLEYQKSKPTSSSSGCKSKDAIQYIHMQIAWNVAWHVEHVINGTCYSPHLTDEESEAERGKVLYATHPALQPTL